MMRRSGLGLTTVVCMAFFVGRPEANAQSSLRDSWQQPEKIMDSLGIGPGMIIGEAGAGYGYFTFHLSKRVGKNGKVYANDIDKKALQRIDDKCKEDSVCNITTVMGKVGDPLFPKGELDGVVIMMAFHDFEKPVEWMNNVMPGLKPGAFLAIIDPDPEKVSRDRDHFWSKEKILATMQKTEFELVHLFSFLERDNIYVYRVNKDR